MTKRIGSKANARIIAAFHYGVSIPGTDVNTFTRLGSGIDRTAYLHEDGFVYKFPHDPTAYWANDQMKSEVKNLSRLRRADLKVVFAPRAHMFCIKMTLLDGETYAVFVTAMDFVDCEEMTDANVRQETTSSNAFRQACREISATCHVSDLHLGNISPLRGTNRAKFGLMDAGL